ncbi:hypothetical protein LTR28_006321 [Elasticomyces elasticus]|nr:hypothetical protein LTR28_006321 [Elasticomyces elasticus]
MAPWSVYTAERHADEDKWEYEYDAEETEEFYFTLDLTTHLPPFLPDKFKRPVVPVSTDASAVLSGGPSGQNRRDASVNTTSVGKGSGNDTPAETPAPSNGATPQHSSQVLPEHLPPESRMQILDLHTTNPLLSYRNALYSCDWATALGTDMFFTNDTDPPHEPLRTGKNFSLLGLSSARLTARPASLRRKATATNTASTQGHPVPQSPGQSAQKPPLRIHTSTFTSTRQVSEARFLERLSAAKRKRDEDDFVHVQAYRSYHRPANAPRTRSEQQSPAAVVAAAETDPAVASTAATAPTNGATTAISPTTAGNPTDSQVNTNTAPPLTSSTPTPIPTPTPTPIPSTSTTTAPPPPNKRPRKSRSTRAQDDNNIAPPQPKRRRGRPRGPTATPGGAATGNALRQALGLSEVRREGLRRGGRGGGVGVGGAGRDGVGGGGGGGVVVNAGVEIEAGAGVDTRVETDAAAAAAAATDVQGSERQESVQGEIRRMGDGDRNGDGDGARNMHGGGDDNRYKDVQSQ